MALRNVNGATSTLIRDLYQTILRRFDAIVASSRRGNLYFQVYWYVYYLLLTVLDVSELSIFESFFL